MTSQIEIAQPVTWLGFVLIFIVLPLTAGYLYSIFWARIFPWMIAILIGVICIFAGQAISEWAPGWVENPLPTLLRFSARLMLISILSYCGGLAIRWIINSWRKPVTPEQWQ